MIQEIENVLTLNECNALINFQKNSLKKLTVSGSDNKDNYRFGYGTWIYNPVFDENNNDINQKLKIIASEKTNLPIENQESVHIVSYPVGGEYKRHHDFFHKSNPEYNNFIKRGGQRSFSLLFYLNENFEGGETKFIKNDLIIKPKTGKLLIWSNLLENGDLDYDSEHAGLPVASGEKWIAIIWVRQGKFI